MKLPWLIVVSAALCACSFGSGRVETLSQAPSFKARTIAIAATRGAGGKGAAIARELSRRLTAGGMRAASLEESDSVLAGSALGLDIAADPRVLAEVRRATGAEAIVFLTLDPNWRTLEVSVLDSRTGDLVLRSTARPSGAAFETPDEAASAAAEALSVLAPERHQAAAAATKPTDEIDLPDVRGGD